MVSQNQLLPKLKNGCVYVRQNLTPHRSCLKNDRTYDKKYIDKNVKDLALISYLLEF